MLRSTLKRALVMTLIAQLVWLGFLPAAQAGLVATQSALALEQREGRLERINAALLRDDVRTEMLRLGVAPSQVQERLAALTDQELQRIEGELDSLPAGGNVAAAIGITFIVLIILELVGVIDIFKKM
ncbi:MAG: PA2779 family protein [Bdellovibrio bacteriovorus]